MRVGDVRTAARFALDHVAELDALMAPGAHRRALPLRAIDAATPRGALLLATARRTLSQAPGAALVRDDELAPALATEARRRAAHAPFNGDG